MRECKQRNRDRQTHGQIHRHDRERMGERKGVQVLFTDSEERDRGRERGRESVYQTCIQIERKKMER